MFDFKTQLKVGSRGEGKKIYFSTNNYTDHTWFLVDDEDYPILSRHPWYVQKRGNNFYITSSFFKRDIHTVILPTTEKNIVIDHKTDWWDNRKENLRLCYKSGNNRNIQARRSKYSDYLGLSFDKDKKNPWRGGVGIQIGTKVRTFRGPARETAEEAALDYDLLAITYHGEFANLNFPGDWND